MKHKILVVLLVALYCSTNIFAEYWDRITNLPASVKNAQWLDVLFLNENYGWICGKSNKVLRTSDGGKTWETGDVNGIVPFYESVSFIDTLNGFCSGPGGVFKTIDGGRFWQPIEYLNSLAYKKSIEIWGCFMLSYDTIYVAGGGCDLYIPPKIWRTTNGGYTWTETNLRGKKLPQGATVVYSALTDVMIYKNGIGYAASSGIVWKTTNYGDTWEAWSANDYPYLAWNEEITNIQGTNVVLVPYSGSDCGGSSGSWAYDEGGMLWTSDGVNWKKYETNHSMFGTFLLSTTTGWACGHKSSIYQTKDAGVSWQLKNCDLYDDQLDDIFFLNDSVGWVVGDYVYKYSPTEIFTNKDTVDFGTICIAAVKYDTVTVSAKTFNKSTMIIQKYHDNPNFQIIRPEYYNQLIDACADTQIVVRFSPNGTTKGIQTFSIIVRVQPQGENYTFLDTIYYRAAVKESDVTTNVDTLDLGDIIVNTAKSGYVDWYSSVNDSMRTFTKQFTDSLSKDTNKFVINIVDSNFIINPDSSNIMEFIAIPKDTGTFFVRYDFVLAPCGDMKSIYVKVRGVTPIINAQQSQFVEIYCKSDTILKIPIRNLGNATLTIDSLNITDTTNSFEILGFGSELRMPVDSILSNEIDTLYIKIMHTDNKSNNITINTNIELLSNDTNRKLSIYPYKISVIAQFKKSSVDKEIQVVDFGDVCVNSTSTKFTSIKNNGGLKLTISEPFVKVSEFSIVSPISVITAEINDTLKYEIEFTPDSVGIFTDTILFTAQPCDLEISIILKGRGVVNDIAIEPDRITDRINVNTTKEYIVSVKSQSPQDVMIDSAKLYLDGNSLVPDNFEISILSSFPMLLSGYSTRNINISAFSEEEKIVSCNLKVFYKSACQDSVIIPIQIEFIDNNITFLDTKDSIIYSLSNNKLCEMKQTFDTVYINSSQTFLLNTLSIINNAPQYKIVSNFNLPIQIDSGASLQIIISFEPNTTGNFKDYLVLEVQNITTNIIKYDTLPLSNSYNFANTYLSQNSFDFGLFEKCEDIITQPLKIYNTGSISDTCYFDLENIPAFITITDNFEIQINNINNSVIVPAMDSISILITCHPELIEDKGIYNNSFNIRTTVCPKNYAVNLHSNLDEISIFTTPSILDFGNVWIDSTKQDTIVITNTSPFEINIDDIKLSQTQNFTLNTNFPFILKVGETKPILVAFIGNITTIYTSDITINASRTCEITNIVPVIATIPSEIYFVEVAWNSVKAIPGENAILLATVVKADHPFIVEQIAIHINMDFKLFYPEKLFVLDNDNNIFPLPFEYHYPDGIDATIPELYAKNILNTKKIFLQMEGLTMLSEPASTSVSFGKFDIMTEKIVALNKIDGDFEIYDYCDDGGMRANPIFMPTFTAEIPNIIIENKNLIIDFYATDDIPITVEIINLLGEQVFVDTIKIEKGKSSRYFYTNQFPIGSYFIKLSAYHYQPILQQIINIK